MGWAARLAHPAVVDQERVAGVGEPGGDLHDRCERALRDHGFLSVAEGDVVARRGIAEMFDQSIPVEADQELLRPRSRATETAEGEVVHELVGQDQLRGSLELLATPGSPRSSRAPGEPGTRLYGRVVHIQIREVVDELSRERAVARPHLGHAEWPRFAQPAVQVAIARPEELGEHGMDVRARDEMTVGADGRIFEEASGTVERELHVFGERDRTVVPDRARDGVAHVHGLQGTRIASGPGQ